MICTGTESKHIFINENEMDTRILFYTYMYLSGLGLGLGRNLIETSKIDRKNQRTDARNKSRVVSDKTV